MTDENKTIKGVSMAAIKAHYDYGIRTNEDVARKILAAKVKSTYEHIFEDIAKKFEEENASDRLTITHIHNGLSIDVAHNCKNNILGEYQSLLRINNTCDEYHYYIIIYEAGGNDEVLDEKTTDVDKMIADIKDVYNWD